MLRIVVAMQINLGFMMRRATATRSDESGFTTAELLLNAALGVAALAAIWGLLQLLGEDIVADIRDKAGL